MLTINLFYLTSQLKRGTLIGQKLPINNQWSTLCLYPTLCQETKFPPISHTNKTKHNKNVNIKVSPHYAFRE